MAQDEFEEVAGLGILSGDAIRTHDSAKVRPSKERDGVVVSVSCVFCGRENEVTVEWAELIIISQGAAPPNWQYDAEHGMFRPYLGCPSCKKPIAAGLTPDECSRLVRAGIAARSLNMQVANQIAAQVQQGQQAQQQTQGLARR